jgi:hypothetical protein
MIISAKNNKKKRDKTGYMETDKNSTTLSQWMQTDARVRV